MSKKENSKRHYYVHKNEYIARAKAWVLAHPKEKHDANRKSNLKMWYGITIENYETMFQKQHGKCVICGYSETAGRHLSVNHSHTTGKVRALLCGNCNRGLGIFKDNPELLLKASNYLEG